MTDYFERTHHGSFWRERGSQPLLNGRRLRTIRSRARGRRLLDIGSGEGFFAGLAARRGWTVTATDYLPEGVERSAQRLGAGRVVRSDATSLPFAPASFDVVTLWDVVEHLPEPAAALAEARRVLAPGGLLALSTPNTRARSVLCRGRDSTQYHDETHVSLWAPEHWEQALATAGFLRLLLGTDAHWDPPYPPSWRPAVYYKVAAQLRYASRFCDQALPDGENLVGLFRRV